MDFEFTPEQLEFVKEVEEFLDANDDPEVFDVTRENMAQIVDTPLRRGVHGQGRASRAGSGITWPEEYGGKDGEGIYEYLLERGAGRPGRAPDRQGRRHHRQDHHQPRQRQAEAGVPAQDPAQRGRVRRRLLRAQRRVGRRVDAAQGHPRRRRLAAQRPEDVDHLGPLRRLVLGGGPHRPRGPQAPRHHPVPGARWTIPGITVKAIWTMGDERTNEVYLDDVWVSDDYVVGELNKGFQYISEALDLERFTLFTYSPDRPAPRSADRVRGHRHPGRRAAEGRRGGAVADRPAAHRGRGGPGARVSSSCSPRRRAASPPDRRGVRVQAVHHRVLAAAGRRLDGHRRSRGPAAGPDRGRPHGGSRPSRPTATR